MNTDDQLMQAMELLKSGKINESKKIVENIFNKSPGNLNALLMMGLIMVHNKNYYYAIDLLKNFTKKINNHPISYANLGIAYLEINEIDHAIENLDVALKLKPDYSEAFFYLGHAYTKLHLYNQAEQSYAKAIKYNPEYIDAYCSLGLLYYEQSAFTRALDVYKTIIFYWPKNINALNQLGHLYYLLKNYDDSIRYFNNSLSLRINQSDTLLERALSYIEIDALDEAMEDCNLALNINPSLSEAYNARAVVYGRFGNIEQAILECTQAITINKNYVEAYNNRVVFYFQLKFFQEALKDCSYLVKIGGANAITYNNIGLIHLSNNENKEAIEALNTAILMDIDNADYYINRGVAYDATKNYQQAIDNFCKAIDIKPDHCKAKSCIGVIELKLKKFNIGWDNYEFRAHKKSLVQLNKLFKLYSANYSKFNANRHCKGLLVIGEQGLGDEIIFSSLLLDLLKTELKVTLIISPKLVSLFGRSFKNITVIGETEDNLSISSLKKLNFDQYIMLGSLGRLYRKSVDDFKNHPKSYLKVDLDQSKKLKNTVKLPNRLLCGISWKSENTEVGFLKSIALNELSKAFDLKKIDLLSLQYGDVNTEIQNVRSNNIFINEIDEIDNIKDIDGLASLISVCDFVVTISNVTAHIAGSLGIKTYLLLPYSVGALWYWHEDDDVSLWYPSIRIFRQDESRNWLTVIQELSDHLKREYEYA